MKFYTAAEARRVLGFNRPIHPNTLKKYVDNGTLRRVDPPGGGRKVYLAKEVDILAEKRRKFYSSAEEYPEDKSDVRFRPAYSA